MGDLKTQLDLVAHELADELAAGQTKVVFAESCTAGLVSATLAHVPGISQWHCGSLVTYRNRSKIDWLRVSTDTIEQVTAVSSEVAQQMAIGALRQTVEATFSAAVTGHLGPEAPAGFDGLIFVGVAKRIGDVIELVDVAEVRLESSSRLDRQSEAAICVMRLLCSHLAKA